jgi:hypothetical protein
MSKRTLPSTVPEGFWKIIEKAQQDPIRFRKLLKKMNRGRIIRFYWTYEELANQLRTERYWLYIHPDLSEDGLAELANWVVAQGKEYYCKILEHPELIPPKKNDAGLMSEVVEEYEQRYNDDIPTNTHEWDVNWKLNGKKSPWV